MNSASSGLREPFLPKPVSYSDVVARLSENGIPHHVLRVGDGASVIVSARSARIYGPFFDEGASELWLPSAFRDADAFSALVDSRSWQVGGERVWVGPEIAYLISDRRDHWNTFRVPSSIDPGAHRIEASDGAITIESEFVLEAHNIAAGAASVAMRQAVSALDDPLRFVMGHHELRRGVEFAGYDVEVRLTADSPQVPVEAWNIAQVQTPGVAVVLGTPPMEVTDYYEPVDVALRRTAVGARVALDGRARFKIGFRVPHVLGRVGFLRAVDDRTSSLLVRQVGLYPSEAYADEPATSVGVNGDAIHVYNDDGDLGGFAELHARGRPLGATSSRHESVDHFMTWLYVGPHAAIDRIALHLLGSDAT